MKRAIIIGATSGIGRALAKQLANEGYALGLTGRRGELLDSLRAELPGATVHTQVLDVARDADAMAALRDLIARMEGLDLCIISAGVGFLNTDLDWDKESDTIGINVHGFAAMANVALRHFILHRKGHLVGISSVAALRGSGAAPAYNASKAFVSNYLDGLRQKVRHLKLPIAVTDVRPGFVATAMAQGSGLFWVASPEKAAKQIAHAIRLRKRRVYVTRRWALIAALLRLMP